MTDLPRAQVLVAGRAAGEVLRLTAPLSFWGGVDPATGRIVDVRHPEHGLSIAGRILVVPETRGSSSSSSVMLELIHAGCGPAGLVMGRVDAILILGLLVAREMGYPCPPAVALPPAALALLPDRLAIDTEGGLAVPDPEAR